MRAAVSVARLSRREAEVAHLVREGLTNREIAERLFISDRTVEGHVQQIHNKLGFNSRAQIAAWVAEGGRPSLPPASTAAPHQSRTRRVPRRWLVLSAMALAAALALVASLSGLQPASRRPEAAGGMAVLVSGDDYTGVAVDRTNDDVYVGACPEVIVGHFHSRFKPFKNLDCSGDSSLAGMFIGSRALAVGPAETLYVADRHANRITRVAANGTETEVAGDTFGSTADGIPARLALINPASIVVTDGGDIYLADLLGSGGGKVRLISGRSGLIQTIAGIGRNGISGDGGPAIDAELGNELHIARFGDTLYISDAYHSVIRAVDATGTITRIAGTGQAGYSGDGGAADRATLNSPDAMAVDSHGDLYVSDRGNGVIRRIHKNVITTVVPGLEDPTDIALDSHGRLYVIEKGNRRVLAFTLPS